MTSKRLAHHLPFLMQEQDALYGSIVISASSPHGSPTREGVIQGACPYFLLLLLVFSLFFFNLHTTTRCCRHRALRAVLLYTELVSGE